jgi:hypothetical protein
MEHAISVSKKTNSTIKIVKHLKNILKELELVYNLSPELTSKQIN